MWIPYNLFSVLAASYMAIDPPMVPVGQPVDALYCKYGDAFWEIQPDYVRAAHLTAMTMAYKNPDAKGYPSVIQPKQIDPVPKWDTVMRQYPVTIPDGPKLQVSPFRVVFSEPETLTDDDGNEIILSEFWNVVASESPSKQSVVCDTAVGI
ncbi:hypothetical protein FRC08_012238 [Ceratobasidium sp. 394]|nr:hypothetical protein FRC08_012238 [Ceratobasidium sp. 394]